MFGRLLLLFLVVPLVDLALLVTIGSEIGLGTTIAIVVLTAVAGSWLARREGLAAWQRVQTRLGTGGVPGPEVIDGLIILVSGTLLLTPGFLTDIVGFLGLLPPSRAVLRRWLRGRFERAVRSGQVRVQGPAFRPSGVGPAGFGVPFGAARPAPIEDAEVIDDGSGR